MLPEERHSRGYGKSPYSLVIATAPARTPITATEVKAHTRIDDSNSDTLITDLIEAVTAHLDGPQGWLGRCLVSQTWDMKLDWFPAYGGIRIPLAPLISIGSITYTDEAGDSQTLSSANYQVVGVGNHMGGYVTEAYNASWPATRDIPEAVTIRFTAGYADINSPAESGVPETIKRAMMIMVSDLFEQRETFAYSQNDAAEVPMSVTAKSLLAPYQINWFA